MAQDTARQMRGRMGGLQWAILVLIVVTALIHLYKALSLTVFASHPGSAHMGPPPGGKAGAPMFVPPSGPLGGLLHILPQLFFLNFLGYLALGVAMYAPLPLLQRYHGLIRAVLIVYASLTIFGYFLVLGPAVIPLGWADKVVEFALIVLLTIEEIRQQPQVPVHGNVLTEAAR
jgi:hypothetical protein